MARKSLTGKLIRTDGFTYMELIAVLLVLSLLASLSLPVVMSSIGRAKEAAQLENLNVMRRAIDDYFVDHGAYPESLEILADENYISAIPIDPMTGDQNWITVASENQEGIEDVQSQNE